MMVSSSAWFRPKSHGYGATPANWKGWLAVALFVVGQLALALLLVVLPGERGDGPSVAALGGWLGLVIVSSVAFVALCRARTEGDWSWRWGQDPGGPPPRQPASGN